MKSFIGRFFLIAFIGIGLFNFSATANVRCASSLEAPRVFEKAKEFERTNPTHLDEFIATFVESGFFLGPKMMELFEKQLINDGLLIYNVELRSFVSDKEQTLHNQKALAQLATSPQSELQSLSEKIFEDLKVSLALTIPHDSEMLSAELTTQNFSNERPWDFRTTSMEELITNHKILSEMIKTKQGAELITELIRESIPLYSHMLNELLIYTNSSVNLASVVAGKLGWSAVLSAAVGFVDPWSLSAAGAAFAGALIEIPSVTRAMLYFKNRKIKNMQEQVGWSVAAQFRDHLKKGKPTAATTR